jgi:predicted phosphate transport protein (TIGR00153 family)
VSDLLSWFQKRRETRALDIMRRHLATTMAIVGDLQSAIEAAIAGKAEEMKTLVQSIVRAEKEADVMRRSFMDELSKGELPPVDREDLMHLMKRVDMVADWCREATRLLNVIAMSEVPRTLKEAFAEMVGGLVECAVSLRKSIDQMDGSPENALRAADDVERQEEKVDDLHEKARMLLAQEPGMKAGMAVLVSQLFEAIERAADACEDACDQVRVIIVRM